MDVKNLIEKLLFDEVEVESTVEELEDIKPIESVIKPIHVEEPVQKVEVEKKPVIQEPVKPAPTIKKTIIDVTDVPYKARYRTSASIEKAQYVRQEPLSPIFGAVSDKNNDQPRKLTTPQFPSNLEGSKKIESVLSPIFGRDLPSSKEEPVVEEVIEVKEEPVVTTKQATNTDIHVNEVKKPVYAPRHAEIKSEDNDVFYTNGLELDKIINLLNDSEKESAKADKESSFLNSVLETKPNNEPVDISIFDED